ncbi:hypothetical protein [Actinomadura madurae]|uniref:hypothetical protein n=1 Tax=Actinomadura madurae TaxID=1993 RepID=UPI0020D2037F|nr:hypothetical protein [Actinomadura madurae]MCP9977689.1 hypothetical protein [Actinomadura madurae]
MPYSLEDLTEVMETRSAGGRPSPDLLPHVRRRIRRGNRRRAAAGRRPAPRSRSRRPSAPSSSSGRRPATAPRRR